MYELAEEMLAADDSTARLIRLVGAQGLSVRWPGEARADLADGRRLGQLLAGAADDAIAGALGSGPGRGLFEVAVGDREAVRAGLACGGRISLLVQPPTDIPARAWESFARRDDVGLVTELSGRQVGPTRLLDDPAVPVEVREAATANGAGTWTGVVSAGGREYFVATYRALTRLVIVGEGLLAGALSAQAALLGWRATVCSDPAQAVPLAGSLGPADLIVVLSHDPGTDVAALAAALTSRAAYVGALGSRHTQARRQEGLAARGVDGSRIHGPAGLDIGSSTPAEVAVAICAEALAVKTASGGGSLRDRPGPIH